MLGRFWRLMVLLPGLLSVAPTVPSPVVAAILTVTDLGDSGASGQLRTLINAAHTFDTILIPPGTITLTSVAGDDQSLSGVLDISESITVQGAGPGLTIIDGGGDPRGA